MKTISIALQDELNRSTARLAKCMRIERRDGNIYGFTTNRQPLTISGLLYLPTSSFNPTDIASGSNLDTDDLQIEGLLSASTVTEDDLRAGRWDYAAFEMFTVNWSAPGDGIVKDRAGNLGKVTVSVNTFLVELLGMMEAYGTAIGKLTQPGCGTRLGTPECGVTPTSVSGTIDSADVSGNDAFFRLVDAARTEVAGFFTEGIITLDFAGGPIQYEVKTYDPGVWYTKTSIAYDATGIDYTMTEGCPGRFQEDCITRFNNAINFRGQPWLRGIDALVQVGRHK